MCAEGQYICRSSEKESFNMVDNNWRNLHEECVGVKIGYIKVQGQSSLMKTIRCQNYISPQGLWACYFLGKFFS